MIDAKMETHQSLTRHHHHHSYIFSHAYFLICFTTLYTYNPRLFLVYISVLSGIDCKILCKFLIILNSRYCWQFRYSFNGNVVLLLHIISPISNKLKNKKTSRNFMGPNINISYNVIKIIIT